MKSATRLTSLIGASTVFDDTDGIHPTRGEQLTFFRSFAGVGGDVRYLRTQAFATKYKSFGSWILSLHGEGGYISAAPGRSPGPLKIRSGSPTASLIPIFGGSTFADRPRVVRMPYDANGNLQALDINKDCQ